MKRLAALHEIGPFKARCNRAAGSQDWSLYEALHPPRHRSQDEDHGGAMTAPGMMAKLMRSIAKLITMHDSHTPEITFVSPTRASDIWALESLSLWRQSSENYGFKAFGRYHETYAKRGCTWLLASRGLRQTHVRPSPTLEPQY